MHQVFIKELPANHHGNVGETKQSIEDAFTWVAINVLPCNMKDVRAQDDIKSDHCFITTLCDAIGSYLANVQEGFFERAAQSSGLSARGLLTDYSIELDNTLRISGNLHGVTYEMLAEAIFAGYCDGWDETAFYYLTNAQIKFSVTTSQVSIPGLEARLASAWVNFDGTGAASPTPALSTSHASTPAGSGRDINAEVLALAIEGVSKTAGEFSQTPAVKNLNKIIDLLEGK